MKRILVAVVLIVSVAFAVTGCQTTEKAIETEEIIGTEIVVVTGYGDGEGNQVNFQSAYEAWELETGNVVVDNSGIVDEEWKASVIESFETDTQPDVLFYFVGSAADDLIENEDVVSIEEIREVYPDYGSNMKDILLPVSSYDGEQYTVPISGYWEGLYVNEVVLEAAGVEVPGADYTWDEFLEDCQKIQEAGYTPIAASLSQVPHYWFEFLVFNEGDIENHTDTPISIDDEVALKWAEGLDGFIELYDLGYFPSDTLTITDTEAVQMFLDGEAAFLIDGSWKVSYITENAEDIEDFTVTYVPGDNDRKATDIIGGLSMGYYITREAWEDEEKREVAVSFVMAMTTDEVVSSFGQTAVTALENGVIISNDMNGLEVSAITMTAGATGVAEATQDGIHTTQSSALFASIPDIVLGNMTSLEAIESALGL
ncbi:MAG: ABC transporter substrate-binding protein [Eubacteriales bacterium]